MRISYSSGGLRDHSILQNIFFWELHTHTHTYNQPMADNDFAAEMEAEAAQRLQQAYVEEHGQPTGVFELDLI